MEKPKLCPICGSIPILEKISMDYGNGHGYPGNYEYRVGCDCDVIKGYGSCSTLNGTHEEAKEIAIKKWNEEVDKVEKLLEWRTK